MRDSRGKVLVNFERLTSQFGANDGDDGDGDGDDDDGELDLQTQLFQNRTGHSSYACECQYLKTRPHLPISVHTLLHLGSPLRIIRDQCLI